MSGSLSVLSLVAAVFYAVVMLACLAAVNTASKYRQPDWNRRAWMALALLFVVLIFLRGLGVEEWARDALRDLMRGSGNYDGRRALQSKVAAGVIVAVSALGAWWALRVARNLRGRRNYITIAACTSGAAMVFLIVLRMISLHIIDRALYGPLKLNWVVDIGSSAAVLGCAIAYIALVRARP